MWATGVVIGDVPANGSAVNFFAMLSVLPEGAWMPLQPSLGAEDEIVVDHDGGYRRAAGHRHRIIRCHRAGGRVQRGTATQGHAGPGGVEGDDACIARATRLDLGVGGCGHRQLGGRAENVGQGERHLGGDRHLHRCVTIPARRCAHRGSDVAGGDPVEGGDSVDGRVEGGGGSGGVVGDRPAIGGKVGHPLRVLARQHGTAILGDQAGEADQQRERHRREDGDVPRLSRRRLPNMHNRSYLENARKPCLDDLS